MKFTRRTPADVEAVLLKYPMTIDGPNGAVKGEAGDYLVTEGERQYFLTATDFGAQFAPKLEITINPQPQIVPYPVPYPVYPQPSYPRYWYGTITSSGSSQMVPLGGVTTAINQGAVNAQLMSGASSVGD